MGQFSVGSTPEKAAAAVARVRGPKLASTLPGPGRRARAACGPVISARADICRRGVYSAVLCSTVPSKQQAAPSLRGVSHSGAQLCVSVHLE